MIPFEAPLNVPFLISQRALSAPLLPLCIALENILFLPGG